VPVHLCAAQRNQAMGALLRDLAAVDGLADALARRPSPAAGRSTPTTRGRSSKRCSKSCRRSSPTLTLVFRAAGAIDFTQGTLAALEALGSADAPSELLLRLDCRIRHLLVDEFQDTSYLQLDLIRSLTAGWEPGDGRTLFAVGDPMQSIYRFRGAEVRLFVAAQETGRIGELPVDNIVLRRNFRSQAHLVGWANEIFPGVLGLRQRSVARRRRLRPSRRGARGGAR
jgi:superfamily I DNA/RNA helicase